MRSGVVGVGVVGEATVTILETLGHEVRKYDPDKGFTDDLSGSDYVFICINTADMNVLKRVAQLYDSVVIRTTALPGTCDSIGATYLPEFLTERTALDDALKPDRIIVGGDEQLASIFQPLGRVIRMTPTEAEIVKLACNLHHAAKVSFANEVYDLCDNYGADYEKVAEGLKADRYINPSHLDVWQDGFRGYAGKCLPKDVDLFIRAALNKEMLPAIALATRNVNRTLRCSIWSS